MQKSPLGTAVTGAAALGLALSLLAPAPALARPVAAPASACVVVLECPGMTQQVAPDATGNFVFKNVPAGSCRMSVVPASSEAAPSVASSSSSSTASSSADARAAVVAPRDAASGLPTGKRQHKPMSFQMVLDGSSAAAATTKTDDTSNTSVTVVVRQQQKEFKGHVTLLK